MRSTRFLLYVIGQGFHGVIFCFIGIVFSHVHQLGGTLTEAVTLYWSLYPIVFLSTALTNGTLRRTLSDIETAHTLPAWLHMIPSAGCLFIWLFTSAAFGIWRWQAIVICVVWGTVDAGILRMCRRKENFVSHRNQALGPGNMRFSLLLPAFTGIITNFLLGAMIPLAIRLDSSWSVIYMGLLGLYILTWFLTRTASRSLFAAIHTWIYTGILACGFIFLITVYMCGVSLPLDLALSLKAFFMACLTGVYLSIPEAYQRTWEQPCTELNLRDRTNTLGLVLCTYDPIVFTISLVVRFSWLFLLFYAVGGAVLFQYTRKRRKHVSLTRAAFSICAAMSLLLEYSGVLPERCYTLQYIDPDSSARLLSGFTILLVIFEGFLSRLRDAESRHTEDSNFDNASQNFFGVARFIRRPIRFTYFRLALLGVLCAAVTPLGMIVGFSQRLTITSLTLAVSLLVTTAIDVLWPAFRKKNEAMVL